MERTGLPFAKGHGTGNDFVIVPDLDGELDLPAHVVASLCDRRFGIGADGVLRVVRTAAADLPEVAGFPDVADLADQAPWFMDYRNADGSLAQMCGNGVRVFARYLVEVGLASGPRVAILTRSGPVMAEVNDDVISVEMPMPSVSGQGVARLSGVDYGGTVATCGNPNLVCFVADPDCLDLSRAPELDRAAFPEGANVEFVAPVPGGAGNGGRHVRMRVVERGVGETFSCGSGACAVAAVVLHHEEVAEGVVSVDVPGGRLTVSLDTVRCTLAGPAVIVAVGEARLV